MVGRTGGVRAMAEHAEPQAGSEELPEHLGAGQDGSAGGSPVGPKPANGTARRDVLRLAGAAAAGAAALAIGDPRRADAADGVPVLIGQANSGSSTTSLSLSPPSPSPTLDVGGVLQATEVRPKGPDPWADVKAYGATGNGTTPDTLAIQSALDAAPVGGAVYLPPGTYLVDALNIRNHVSLVGAGWKGSVLKAKTPGITVLTVNGDAALTYTGVLRDFQIDGNRTANYGIYLAEGTSRCTIQRVWVRNCSGVPGTGIANENHAFSVTYDRIHVESNNIGVRLRGAVQDSKIVNSQLYANASRQLDIGDGTSRVGRIVVENTQLERANVGSGGDVTNVRLQWVDPIEFRSVYAESHTTTGSIDMEVVPGNICRIEVDGWYTNGSRQANNAFVLPGDDTIVHLSLRNCYFVDYLLAEITNADKPNKFIYDEAGPLEFTTAKDVTYLTADRVSAPLAGFGRLENQLKQSEALDQSPWTATFGAGGTAPTVTPNAITAPDWTLSADKIDFGTLPSRVQQTTSLVNQGGRTFCFSVWLRADAPGMAEIYFTTGTWRTRFCHLTTTWKRFFYVGTVPAGDTSAVVVRISKDSAIDLGTIYAWGAQLEMAPGPGVYVQTKTAPISAGYGVYTHPNARIGFGKEPTVTVPRSLGPAATDAASTQTLANNIRQALIDLGLGTT
jgi:hypothetical protein